MCVQFNLNKIVHTQTTWHLNIAWAANAWAGRGRLFSAGGELKLPGFPMLCFSEKAFVRVQYKVNYWSGSSCLHLPLCWFWTPWFLFDKLGLVKFRLGLGQVSCYCKESKAHLGLQIVGFQPSPGCMADRAQEVGKSVSRASEALSRKGGADGAVWRLWGGRELRRSLLGIWSCQRRGVCLL